MSVNVQENSFSWQRRTYPRGVVPAVDERGWIVPWASPELKTLEELRGLPVVVLTAERGSGKTYLLRGEAEAVRGRYVHLPDLSADFVGQLTAIADECGSDGVWHLLVDSYDEALADDGFRPALLKSWLAGLAPDVRSRLRLRIATRPGPRSADDALLAALGSGMPGVPVRVHELAHLTAAEVGGAARRKGLDPAAFLADVNRLRLQPLASIPVTLLMLLDGSARGQELPETASEAYERACVHWCEETNPDREGPRAIGVKQLVAAAELLAVALHLCSSRPVVTTVPAAAAAGDLTVSSLAQGEERGFELSEAVLYELLQSGLMTSLGERRWSFAHRSVQEFLASQYLRGHAISDAGLSALLVAGSGADRHAVTAVRDLAGWVATWNDALFTDLLQHDPFTLLQTDLAARADPDRDRGQLVDAVIERIVAEYPAPLTPYAASLYRLDHPALPGRLEPHLRVPSGSDPARSDPRLSAAILIAQSAVPENRPTAALVEVARSASVHPGLRAAALRSVGALLPSQADALKTLLSPDEPAEVAWAVLEALRPTHLSAAEVLEHGGRLSPERLPQLLPQGDDAYPALPTTLAWAAGQVEQRPKLDGSPGPARQEQQAEIGRRVRAAIHAAAWALGAVAGDVCGDSPGHAEEIARVFVALTSVERLWDYLPPSLPEDLHNPIVDDNLRRDVAALLLPALTEETVYLALDGPLHVFPPQDRLYWAQRFTDAPAAERTCLAVILNRHIDLGGPELDLAKELAAGDAALADLIEPWWTAPAAGSAADVWRERGEAQAAAERDRWRFDPAITQEQLTQQPGTPCEVRDWWFRVSLSFGFRTADGARPSGSSFADILDLTGTPCCPAVGTTLRDAIEDAAAKALTGSPPVTVNDVRNGGFLALDSAAEIRALTVLSSPPDLAPERWAGLAFVLMSAQVRREDTATRTELLARAVTAAGDAFLQTLPAILGRLGAKHTMPPAIAALVDAVPQCAAAVASSLPGLDDEHWPEAVRALAGVGCAEALADARTALSAPARTPDGPSARWIAAADVLLQHGTSADWARIWPQLLADGATALAWAQETRSWNLASLAELTAQQMGRLYDFLVNGGHLNPARDDTHRDPAIWHGAYLATLPELIANQHITPEAQAELQRLAKAHPAHSRLPGWVRAHALLVAEADWQRPTWPELHQVATDNGARLVHTASQLADIVMHCLGNVQNDLTGPNGLAVLLWNRVSDQHNPTKTRKKGTAAPLWAWWPAWEQDLSDLVAKLLTLHLGGHRVVVNREVQLDREGRTDILVQATHPTDARTEPISVIIEAKGCWNKQLGTSLRTQLSEHYLKRHGNAAGIYLIGHFDSDYWTKGNQPKNDTKEKEKEKDSRRHRRHSPAKLRDEQQHLANGVIEQTGYDIRVCVLNCRPDGVTTATGEDS